MDIVGNKALDYPLSVGAQIVGNGAAIASRLIPTLTGTQSGQLSTPIVLAAGDTLSFKFATTTTGTSMFLCGHSSTPASVEFDAGDLLQLVGGTATIDGTAVADGASIAGYEVGKLHELVFTATGTFTVGYFWQNGSGAGFFKGETPDVVHTDNSGTPVVTNYVFDSGSTVEQYARGSDTLKVTFTAFTAANWNRYTLQRNILHDAGTIAEAWVGDNVVVNGGFDADTDWTKNGVNISIASGVCVWGAGTVAGDHILQNISGVTDSIYLTGVTVDAYTSGDAKLRIGNTGEYPLGATGVGVHTVVVTATGTDLKAIATSATPLFSLDNISAQKLLEVA